MELPPPPSEPPPPPPPPPVPRMPSGRDIYKAYDRGSIGIEVETRPGPRGPHVVIVAITPRSPGDDAGFQVGDVITSWDGKPITSVDSYLEVEKEAQATGEDARVRVLRRCTHSTDFKLANLIVRAGGTRSSAQGVSAMQGTAEANLPRARIPDEPAPEDSRDLTERDSI
eukprot:247740_1